MIKDIENWSFEESSSDFIYRWRHNDYNIWMTVSKKPDHYEDGEQVMRWDARVTLGKNITVGQNERNLCRSEGCEEAKKKTMEWARNWMENQFNSWIEGALDGEEQKRWKIDKTSLT